MGCLRCKYETPAFRHMRLFTDDFNAVWGSVHPFDEVPYAVFRLLQRSLYQFAHSENYHLFGQ